ncbi:MAG: MscL family protein [Candidatus Diapherotrites archaeon]
MKQWQQKKPEEKKKSFIQEFMEFIKKYQIIGLAIAFIMGGAAQKLITAFVTDIISPLLAIFLGKANFEQFKVTVLGANFLVGALITALIDFLVVALVIFIVIKYAIREAK